MTKNVVDAVHFLTVTLPSVLFLPRPLRWPHPPRRRGRAERVDPLHKQQPTPTSCDYKKNTTPPFFSLHIYIKSHNDSVMVLNIHRVSSPLCTSPVFHWIIKRRTRRCVYVPCLCDSDQPTRKTEFLLENWYFLQNFPDIEIERHSFCLVQTRTVC